LNATPRAVWLYNVHLPTHSWCSPGSLCDASSIFHDLLQGLRNECPKTCIAMGRLVSSEVGVSWHSCYTHILVGVSSVSLYAYCILLGVQYRAFADLPTIKTQAVPTLIISG